MDEKHNGFDQPPEPVEPGIDPSFSEDGTSPDESSTPRPPAGREMLTQLQQMIDTISYQAAPVVREVAAKAAELAAVAGVKAGPLAHKAADLTDQLGQRVAARSKEMAADLRRPRDEGEPAAEGTEGESEPADSGSSESGSFESGSGDSTGGDSTGN